MSQNVGNVSNIIGLGAGGLNSAPLTIPEANSQGYFTLHGGGVNVGNNGFGPLFKNGVAYQVPNGKTCKVVAMGMNNSTNSNSWQLCSATAAITDGDASITGGVYQSGAAATGVMITSPTATLRTVEGLTYDFAQNTYAGWQNVSGSSSIYLIDVICKEV